MSDEKALLAAIWEYPHEDAPRLVYADWLQETEKPVNVARAEFIRLQIERARLDEWDDAARIEQLKQREEELWEVHRKEWKSALPKELKSERFQRGFVYSRDRAFGGEKFLKLAPNAFDAAPQWSVNLSLFARLFDKVFRSPLLFVATNSVSRGESTRMTCWRNWPTTTGCGTSRICTPAQTTAFPRPKA